MARSPSTQAPAETFVLVSLQSTVNQPPPSVLAFLRRCGLESGTALLAHLRSLCTELGSPFSSSRALSHGLNDVHAALVQLDEGLTEYLSKPEDAECVDQCRSWLRSLQVFLMALQKDVEFLVQLAVGAGTAGGCGQQLALEPQQHAAWNRVKDSAHEKLLRLLANEGLTYKPVCPRSTLSYNRYWANKHAL